MQNGQKNLKWKRERIEKAEKEDEREIAFRQTRHDIKRFGHFHQDGMEK